MHPNYQPEPAASTPESPASTPERASSQPQPERPRSQVAGTESTEPWAIQESAFPAHGTARDKLRFLVGYAVLAPSYDNAQPWLWKEDGDALRLYLQTPYQTHQPNFDERQMLISCGAALSYLVLALHYFGYHANVSYFPESQSSNYLAHVELAEGHILAPEEARLFRAIPRRHTNRKLFQARDIPPATLQALHDQALHDQALHDQARQEGVWVQFLTEWAQREALLDLIIQGDLEQWSDEQYSRERQQWIREQGQEVADGIPVQALGYNSLEYRLLPLAMRLPLIARLIHLNQIQADRNWLLAGGAPVLGVMGTEADRGAPRDYLAVGEALGRLLLQGCAEGLAFSFFNSPVELFRFWPQVFAILERRGFLHLIFRIGYPTEDTPPTPRRAPDAVISDQ